MEPTINLAIRKGYFQQVRFLIEMGSGLDDRDEERRTPLINCALVEDESWGVGLSRMLIEKGANMSFRDKRGMNILHYACIHARKELIHHLLTSADFNIHQPDRLGNTPLHYAASKGNLDIVREMVRRLQRYMFNTDRTNKCGVTPLMQAWKHDNEECATVLIEQGRADPLNLRDFLENKNAAEFEEDYRLRKENRRNKENLKPNLHGIHKISYMRPKSAAASTSTLSTTSTALGSSVSRRQRPVSAFLLNRRRLSASSLIPEEEEDPVEQGEKDKLAGRLYKSASHNDLRNKPDQILNISPIECFVDDGRFSITGNLKQSSQSLASQTHPPALASNWKSEIKTMYSAFEFQFTGSYRVPAKPVEYEGSEGYDRSYSPYVDSERSVMERILIAKKISRKATDKLQSSIDAKQSRKGSGRAANSRKSSSSSGSSTVLKAQQNLLDSGSIESVNTSPKNGKSASENSRLDKNGKGRNRRLSMLPTDDHVSTSDQPQRGNSRAMPIPVVKEPPVQEQLDVINE